MPGGGGAGGASPVRSCWEGGGFRTAPMGAEVRQPFPGSTRVTASLSTPCLQRSARALWTGLGLPYDKRAQQSSLPLL